MRPLDYYLRINPSAREGISDLHRCEPYVYAQMIAGASDAPDARRGQELLAQRAPRPGTTWRSRSGSWASGPSMRASASRRSSRLSWSGFTAEPGLPGRTYRITVERQGPGNMRLLTVDGQPVAGDIVPFATPGSE